jgi:energy-coupling factor transport system ATP-binding protein
MKTKRVVFSHVTFRYREGGDPGSRALEVDDLHLDEGRRYLLTGHCGSGKTTLAMLLKGLVDPTSGNLRIVNSQQSLRAFQRSIGFTFQFPEEQFFMETIAEEIAFGPTMCGVADTESRIRESLASVGLPYEAFALQSPFELSSGQKRRLGIATVIACCPSWYIFDEPTAGLDPEGKRIVVELIAKLAEEGRTVLIITQELGIFAQLCDEIIVLERGRVLVKTGTEAFFENAGNDALRDSFPYHIRVLAALREKGWDLPVSVLDPVAAAAKIAASIQ